MGSKWGVQVQHDGHCYLVTTSEKGEEKVRNCRIEVARRERELARSKRLLEKMEAALAEITRREIEGKSRRPRKPE